MPSSRLEIMAMLPEVEIRLDSAAFLSPSPTSMVTGNLAQSTLAGLRRPWSSRLVDGLEGQLGNQDDGRESAVRGAGQPEGYFSVCHGEFPADGDALKIPESLPPPVRQNVAPKFVSGIPFFSGNNPREWVSKCERVFEKYSPPNAHRVLLAARYFEHGPETWFVGWRYGHKELVWGDFVAALCKRFAYGSFSGTLAEFNKLRQRGSLLEYQEKFEELRSRLVRYTCILDEEYFISRFISGLEEVLSVVQMLQPHTLAEAYQQARSEEVAIEASSRKNHMRSVDGDVLTSPVSTREQALNTLDKAASGMTSEDVFGDCLAVTKMGKDDEYDEHKDTTPYLAVLDTMGIDITTEASPSSMESESNLKRSNLAKNELKAEGEVLMAKAHILATDVVQKPEFKLLNINGSFTMQSISHLAANVKAIAGQPIDFIFVQVMLILGLWMSW